MNVGSRFSAILASSSAELDLRARSYASASSQCDRRLDAVARLECGGQRVDRLVELAERDPDLAEPHPLLAVWRDRDRMEQRPLRIGELAGAALADAERELDRVALRVGRASVAQLAGVGELEIGGALRELAEDQVCAAAERMGSVVLRQMGDRLVELRERRGR